jgi:hypothetical protein
MDGDELLESIERWRRWTDEAKLSDEFRLGYHAACLSVISWVNNQKDTATSNICPSCHARGLAYGQETCAACSQY